MKYIRSILLGLLFAPAIFGQPKQTAHPLVDSIYQQWQRKRVDSLRRTPWDTFYYAPQIPLGILDGMKEGMLEVRSVTQLIRSGPFRFKDTTDSERILLTQAEVDTIIQGIEFSKQFEWPDGLFVRGQQMRLGVMDTMRRKLNKKEVSIVHLFPYQLRLFSIPVMFRNNSLCVFYRGEADVLDTYGEAWLYRKEQGVWKEFGRLFIFFDMDWDAIRR